MTNYKKDYERENEIIEAYDRIKNDGNEEAINELRHQMGELHERIEARGKAYWRGYERYKAMRDRGNDYIMVDECIHESDVEGLVEDLRAAGFTEFVYNSTWSGAIKTAWLFTRYGCTIEGMTEMNGRYIKCFTNEYEKTQGLIIKL